MKRRVLMFLLVWEPLARAVWAWLRYCDNRRKNKPLTPPATQRSPQIRKGPEGF